MCTRTLKLSMCIKFSCFLNNAIINYTDSIRGQLPSLPFVWETWPACVCVCVNVTTNHRRETAASIPETCFFDKKSFMQLLDI